MNCPKCGNDLRISFNLFIALSLKNGLLTMKVNLNLKKKIEEIQREYGECNVSLNVVKIYGMALPYDVDEIIKSIRRTNKMTIVEYEMQGENIDY